MRCSPLVDGLGAGGDADGAACNACLAIRAIRAGVDNETASNDALLTEKSKVILVLVNCGDTLLVGLSHLEVANHSLGSLAHLGVVHHAIDIVVAASAATASTEVTEGVHMEAVLAWGDAPDRAIVGDTLTGHLGEVNDATDPGLLLGVLKGALGELGLVSDVSLLGSRGRGGGDAVGLVDSGLGSSLFLNGSSGGPWVSLRSRLRSLTGLRELLVEVLGLTRLVIESLLTPLSGVSGTGNGNSGNKLLHDFLVLFKVYYYFDLV